MKLRFNFARLDPIVMKSRKTFASKWLFCYYYGSQYYGELSARHSNDEVSNTISWVEYKLKKL